jgi:glycosyltransferase involved in cell wall biosynthesis
MRILILNWRDVRSPGAGGAERLTHEIATRLVASGHEVTWLSSYADGLLCEEMLEGVRVLRRGSEATTRFYARGVAREVGADVILEEINTLPYFSPLWSSAPVVLFMNQLAREVWWYEAPLPLAVVGWLLEPLYLQAYRRCVAITISRSSLLDLRRLGLRRPITVIPMAPGRDGVSAPPRKRLEGRMIAIGRMAPSKRYDHAIRALQQLRGAYPDASLTIVGQGPMREDLERVAKQCGVADAVVFAGSTTEAEKERLIDAADVLVGTSVREGWGLTVTEAAVRATPAVVYDIPGFRDAVIPDRTGLLVRPDPGALADGVAWLLRRPDVYDDMRKEARRLSAMLSFDATAGAVEDVLVRAAAS